MKTVFLRLIDAEDKALELRRMTQALDTDSRRFEVDAEEFSAVPRSPFAYWVHEGVREIYQQFLPFESPNRVARGGVMAQNDTRFIRTWWEVDPRSCGKEWFPLHKGGAFSPYYADAYLLTDWWEGGRRPRVAYETRAGSEVWGGFGRNEAYYFRPGLTWPLRTTSGLALRAMSAGCVFGHKGPSAFIEGDSSNDLLALLAIANSAIFSALAELQLAAADAAARSYEVGVIQRTPIPELSDLERTLLAGLARRAWSLKRSIDTSNENSHAFSLPRVLQVTGTSLAARSRFWAERVRAAETELARIQTDIDARCFVLYGISDGDQHLIATRMLAAAAEPTDGEEATDAEDSGRSDDSEEIDETTADLQTLTAELLTWAVGVAFSRFDVRLATGDRPLPPEPEPFDPLPVCSPGMLTGDDGLPLAEPPCGHPISFLSGGFLVDDPGAANDLTANVRAVFDVGFGADADARWTEAAELIDPKRRDLRAWLSESFFEYHIKRYSKSRRKAPIYWQLATPSASYSVWIYAHRLTSDTFFRIQNDVVAPKLAHEESKLASLTLAAGTTPDKKQRKELDAQETFIGELRAMLDEVKRVAPLWKPDLDDGVVLTMAPLWRLVPQHRAWQKELKTAWDALCAGTYDWAHIAMHLWPERVVPECVTDRSFAIAHGLEDELWVVGFDEKWRQRTTLDKTIAHVVQHYVSHALRSALDDVRKLWRERYADKGSREKHWWYELESGGLDDSKIAYSLWPSRVMAKALGDPELARVHRIELDEVLPGATGPRKGGRKKAPREPEPMLSPTQLSMLATFCCDLEGYTSWEARWEAWDAGAFDGVSPLALRVRTLDVVKRAAEDHAVAATFGLERWFWIEAPGGPRKLRAPDDEVRDAIEARSSETVKAALASLMDAPQAGGGAKRAKKGRSDA